MLMTRGSTPRRDVRNAETPFDDWSRDVLVQDKDMFAATRQRGSTPRKQIVLRIQVACGLAAMTATMMAMTATLRPGDVATARHAAAATAHQATRPIGLA